MNITVRVAAARAQAQLKQLQGQVASLERELGRASTAGGSFIGDKHISAMAKWGNQVQWTGRQISYNFTLPLAIAAGAATKWELANQKAFTQVQKVYGDTTAAAEFFMRTQKGLTQEMANQKATEVFNNELESLQKNFKALSNYYGVAQDEVIQVGAAWAAAGASGKDLAVAVDATMKAIILGDMDAAAATQALISIQSQYKLNSEELMKTLSQLNAVENQTGISMQGLIEGFERAAGTAQTAGVSTRELAAMLAALTPATGSAANAGNALKTILSRLVAPTKQAADVMAEMGINVTDLAWKSANGSERLKIMETQFDKLSDSGKSFVSSIIASRWQVNKFDVLMRELGSTTGFYQKALDATSSDTKVFQIAQQELNKVLESNPRKLQIIWTTLQNGAADAIQPLIPYIIYLASVVKDLVVAFQEIPAPVQKLILVFAVLLALFGPLLKYFGSTATLIGQLGLMFGKGLAIPIRGAAIALGGFSLALSSVGTAWGAMVGVVVRGAVALPAAVIAATTASMTALKIFAVNLRVALALAFLPIRPWLLATLAKVFVVPMAGLGASVLFALGSLPTVIKGIFAPMVATVGNAVAGMILAIMRFTAVTGPLASVWGATSLALQKVWWAMYTAFTLTFGVLPRIAAAAAAGVTTIWATLSARMVVIQATMTTRIVGLFTAMEAGVVTIMTRLRATLFAIWASIALAPAKFLLFFKTLPARIGPAVAAVGARVATLGPLILAGLKTIGPMLLRVVTGPIGLIVTAVVTLLVLCRKQIEQIWTNIVDWWNGSNNNLVENIIKAWYALPEGVTNALVAVAKVVQKIALQIYEWFSYINPFAHHSPSLVENVTKGMAVIAKQFGTLDSIKGHITGAYAVIKQFGALTASLGLDGFSQDLAQIAEFAPQLAPGFIALHNVLGVLNKDLVQMESAIAAQEAVVNRWQDALDRANAKLDDAQAKLDALQKVSQKYSDLLDAAKQKLSDWADTPIQGMQAMSDKIFANEQAQKKLRLEMLKMEQVNGTLDDLQAKMSGLNGTIETLTAEQTDLRNAGAGSDITGYYDQQLAGLEAQKQAINDQMKPFDDLNKALDDLQRKGEILDLENSLKFDPLTRQIELASKAMQEMPFGVIMAGITAAKADIDKYTGALDQANAAVDKQQAVVDQLTAARDITSKQLDVEKDKLDKLNDSYSALKSAINDVESAMRDMGSAAGAAEQAVKAQKAAADSGAAGNMSLADAQGGNFADVGGTGVALRKDWTDQSAEIDKLTADLMKKSNDAFKGIDMFAPVKKKWSEFKGWWGQNISPIFGTIGDLATNSVANVDWSGIFKPFEKAGKFIAKVGKSLWELFSPSFKEIVDSARKGIKQFWDQVGPTLSGLRDLVEPIKEAWKTLWPSIKIILGVVIGLILVTLRTAFDILGNIIGPIIEMIGGVLKGIILILKGVVQAVLAIINGDWKLAFEAMWNMVQGTWFLIWSLFRGIGKILWGIIKGVVEGIVGFFKWLYDVLVGHSIIPDMINLIIAVFKWLLVVPKWIWNYVLVPIYNAFKNIWNTLLKPFIMAMVAGAILLIKGIAAIVKWVWNYVLVPLYNGFKAVWYTYLKPFIGTIADGISSGWKKIGDLIKWTNDKFVTPLKTAFSTLVEAIGKIFDKVQSKVSGPIDKIKGWINNNLIDPLNKVVKLFGLTIPKLSEGGPPAGPMNSGGGHTPGLANGGRVKGFSSSSTADNIPAWLTANEYVQPVSAVRHYGPAVMDAIRHKQIPKEAFSTDGFFLGGLIDKGLKTVDSWMEKGPEFAINKIMNPAIGQANNAFPSPEFVNKVATGAITQTRDAMLKWSKGQFTEGAGPAGPPGNVVNFRGKRLNERTIQMLLAAERLLGGAQFTITQGSYSTSVAASGSTHAGGGAMDTNDAGVGPARAQAALRSVGFAAWWRLASQGPWNPHMHSIAMGDPTASQAAKNQMAAYRRGGDGLGHGMNMGGLAQSPLLYDSGGMLAPGISTVVNNSRKPEPVFANADWRTMRTFIRAASEEKRTSSNNSSGTKNYNFHNVKFEFPNVKNGEDAEAFLDNLEGLVG